MPEPTVKEMRARLGELIDWVGEHAPDKAVQLDATVAWLEADAIVRQTAMKTLSVEEGAAVLELVPPREIVIAWVHAARAWLGEAPNYTETRVDFPGVSMTVKAAGEAEQYVFTLQRAGKTTPHEARRQAEADLEAMRGRAESLLAGWKDHPDGTIARVCRHILGLPEPTDD